MLTSDFFNQSVEENCKYGRYYCTTDKKYKCRQGPKQTRTSESVTEEVNTIDTVEMDVPLLIRALEYAREDAKDDMDLHKVVERMIAAAQAGEALNMDDYTMIFGDQEEPSVEVDEAKRKKKKKSSLMSKPTKRGYGGYFYPGYGYYGDSGDSGGGDGGGGGESRIAETRRYYRTHSTDELSLKIDFGLRKDPKGWYLPESVSVKTKLDVERAFGEPIAEMNLLRPIKMKGPKNPVAVNQNGNKYKNPAKLIKFGK